MQSVGTGWGVARDRRRHREGRGRRRSLGWLDRRRRPARTRARPAGIAGHIFPVWTRFRGRQGRRDVGRRGARRCSRSSSRSTPRSAAIGALGLRNAERAIWVSAARSGSRAALVWWLADLPNLWGPEPTVGLPIFAVVSAVMILGKFAAARPPTSPSASPVIALVTDSNAQLPASCASGSACSVVPLTIVLDGEDRIEGVDLSADEFYDRLAAGADGVDGRAVAGSVRRGVRGRRGRAARPRSSRSTSARTPRRRSTRRPSRRASSRRSRSRSSTPARRRSRWRAACGPPGRCSSAAGPRVPPRPRRARSPTTIDNVFVVGALDLARRGGRLAAGADARRRRAFRCSRSHGGTMEVVERAHDVEGAVEAMVPYFVRGPSRGRAMRVGVGQAGAEAIGRRPRGSRSRRAPRSPSSCATTSARRWARTPVRARSGAVFFPDDAGALSSRRDRSPARLRWWRRQSDDAASSSHTTSRGVP